MTVLPLIIAPDPILKQKSAAVTEVNDEVRTIAENMLDTMYRAGGIGLAAVQVGILKRIIVVDINWRDEDLATREPIRMVNPEVVWNSGDDHPYNEGCLSFPDHYSEVVRPAEVKVSYLDMHGQKQEMHVAGLLATCIQHEIDHTNGINFVDHISRVKRDIIINKLKKAKRFGAFDHHDHDHVHGEHCNH